MANFALTTYIQPIQASSYYIWQQKQVWISTLDVFSASNMGFRLQFQTKKLSWKFRIQKYHQVSKKGISLFDCQLSEITSRMGRLSQNGKQKNRPYGYPVKRIITLWTLSVIWTKHYKSNALWPGLFRNSPPAMPLITPFTQTDLFASVYDYKSLSATFSSVNATEMSYLLEVPILKCGS